MSARRRRRRQWERLRSLWPDAAPGPVRESTGLATLLIAVLCALAVYRNPPRLLPESMELVGIGRCLLGWSSPLFCEDYESLFWSPVYPLLVAPVASLLEPLTAGGLVSLVAFAAILAGIWGTLAPRVGPSAALMAVTCAGVSPTLSSYAMLVDARATALGLLWGSLAIAMGRSGDHRETARGVFAGVLVGAAALTRPEALVALPGVLLLAAFRWNETSSPRLTWRPRRSLGALAGVAALWVPWTLALSWSEGRPTLLPRGVQKVGFALSTVVPERWARQAIGESAARQPLRDAIRAGPWPTDLPAGPGLDPLAGGSWLLEQLPAVVSTPGLLLGLFGLVVLLGTRRPTLAVAALVTAAPALVAVIALPGRDDMMPASALLPLVVVVHVGMGLTVATFGRGLLELFGTRAAPAHTAGAPSARTAGVGTVLAASLGVSTPALHWPEGPDNAPSGRAAAAALAEQLAPGTRVAAPFASALVVHRAGMRWVPWPAPWESALWTGTEGPRWAIISGVDDALGVFDLGLPPGDALEPRWAVGSGPSAVVLFERIAETDPVTEPEGLRTP